MSLIIGGLALRNIDQTWKSAGVVGGSILAAVTGFLVLLWATRGRAAAMPAQ